MSYSALDRYFGVRPAPLRTIRWTGDIAELARGAEELRFPALLGFDAVEEPASLLLRDAHRGDPAGVAGPPSPADYVVCDDSDGAEPPYLVQTLLYDPAGNRYIDPQGIYRSLRLPAIEPNPASILPQTLQLLHAGVLLSRYDYTEVALNSESALRADLQVDPEHLRLLLTLLLTGRSPWRGLDFWRRHGIIEAFFPELDRMGETQHSKEGHPEGDVWKHTLETFRHRKNPRDLVLSFALLLHDSGKPLASARSGNAFDGHAGLGAKNVRTFLRRIECDESTVEEVAYLVGNHMYPGALHRFPQRQQERIMAHPHFARLLEVYRCDVLATYRGPDEYHRACRIYRRYTKDRRGSVRRYSHE